MSAPIGSSAIPLGEKTLSKVRLQENAIKSLLESFAEARIDPDQQGTGIRGILFGSIQAGCAQISRIQLLNAKLAAEGQDNKAFTALVEDTIIRAARRPGTLDLDAVGWFSTRPAGLNPVPELARLVRKAPPLRDPTVLLLSNPSVAGLTVECYVISEGTDNLARRIRYGWTAIPNNAPLSNPVEMPLFDEEGDGRYLATYEAISDAPKDAGQHTIGEKLRALKSRPRPSSAPSREEGALVSDGLETNLTPADVNALRPRSTPKLGLYTLLMLLTAGVLSVVFLFVRRNAGSKASPIVESRPITIVAADSHQNSGVGLQVRAEGDRLRLTWDRSAPPVQAALHALLTIDDGPEHRLVTLDLAQLNNGSVLYKPHSDDIAFHLDIESESGHATDAVRVLGEIETANKTSEPVREPEALNAAPPVAKPIPPVQKAGSAVAKAIPPVQSERSGAIASESARSPINATPLRVTPTPSMPKVVTQNATSSNVPAVTAPRAITQDAAAAPAITPASAGELNNSKTAPLAASSSQKPPPFAGNEPVVAKPAAKSVATPPVEQKPSLPRAVSAGVYIPPQPLQKLTPKLRAGALRLERRIEVGVVVHVNENGRVTHVRMTNSASELTPEVVAALLETANAWRFVPAHIGQKKVEGEFLIRFGFNPSGM